MDLIQAMKERHSVRKYQDRPIEGETLAALQAAIDKCNQESGLNMQLILNDTEPFGGIVGKLGGLANVKNYVALVGPEDAAFGEKCGYYGEQVVLVAQQLGLNTCWMAGSYNKKKAKAVVKPGEKQTLVISVGYGENPGKPHKNKPMEKLCTVAGDMPEWFRAGMEAALMAPTGANMQKFHFELKDGNKVEATGKSQVDFGIVKYHFALGAGDTGWEWATPLFSV